MEVRVVAVSEREGESSFNLVYIHIYLYIILQYQSNLSKTTRGKTKVAQRIRTAGAVLKVTRWMHGDGR